MPVTFFNLPRELRDQVYGEIWDAKPVIKLVSNRDVIIIASYNSKPPPLPTVCNTEKLPALPPWLLTNKTILSEALEEFEHNSTMSISNRSENYRPVEFSKLISPLRVRELHHATAWESRWPAGSEWNMQRIHLQNSDVAYIGQLFSSLSATQRVKKVRIYFRIFMDRYYKDTITLEPLRIGITPLPHLQQLEVLLEDGYEDERREALVQSLQSEVLQFGAKVMHGVPPKMEKENLEGATLGNGEHLLWRFTYERK